MHIQLIARDLSEFVLCANCQLPRHVHACGKCPFAPTQYLADFEEGQGGVEIMREVNRMLAEDYDADNPLCPRP